MTNLKISERQNGSIIILDLEGKIRLGDGSAKLHEELRLLVNRGEKKILLNMEDVSHIDSSGLGELVSGFNTFDKIGGVLKLVHLSDRVHELMILTKLLTVFEVYENETEAIESFTNKTAKSANAESVT